MSDDARLKTARWQRLREWFLRSNPLCHYCAKRGRIVPADTVDHAMPVSRGGDFWDATNLRPACGACNYSKQDKTEEEFAGCSIDGYGGFWDEKNQVSLSHQIVGGPCLHTKREIKGR